MKARSWIVTPYDTVSLTLFAACKTMDTHIVVVIRGQAQVVQNTVSKSIAQVATAQLQAKELDMM
jgi:hypothetical protein